MADSLVLEVGIGLAVVFFVVATLVASINEWLSRVFDIRAKVLWLMLANALDTTDRRRTFSIQTRHALTGFVFADRRPSTGGAVGLTADGGEPVVAVANAKQIASNGGPQSTKRNDRTRVDHVGSQTLSNALVELLPLAENSAIRRHLVDTAKVRRLVENGNPSPDVVVRAWPLTQDLVRRRARLVPREGRELMGTKIDWLNDPAAPPANSIVPAAAAVVVNDKGQILLIERSDNGLWALPGGAMDLGESLPHTAVRETREETGYEIEITGLVGIYTDPDYRIEYTSNGEVRQEFSIVFTARPLAGEPTVSTEATKVAWVAPDQLAELEIHDTMRKRIQHYLDGREQPYLG